MSSSDSCIPRVALEAMGDGFAGSSTGLDDGRSGIEEGTFCVFDEVVVFGTCVVGVAVVENYKISSVNFEFSSSTILSTQKDN